MDVNKDAANPQLSSWQPDGRHLASLVLTGTCPPNLRCRVGWGADGRERQTVWVEAAAAATGRGSSTVCLSLRLQRNGFGHLLQ